jgi:hypothetical protein
MKKRTAYKPRQTSISNRAAGSLPWSYFVVIAICGCIIAAGFLLAARQHFVSMDLGMKNSKLRKQLDDLESENRRLTLAREVALSPIEITKTARSLGFIDAASAPLPTLAAAPATNTATMQKASLARAEPSTGSTAAIVKTSISRPAAANAAVSAKQAAKPEPARPKFNKPDMTAVAKLR